MALTNAEKQRRWRTTHAGRRRTAARITTMLMRRSHSDGRAIGAKIGWNSVTFDAYFLKLAVLICDALKTDRAIRQLRWALSKCLDDRKMARARERWLKQETSTQDADNERTRPRPETTGGTLRTPLRTPSDAFERPFERPL
jgi:hypothetical protein